MRNAQILLFAGIPEDSSAGVLKVCDPPKSLSLLTHCTDSLPTRAMPRFQERQLVLQQFEVLMAALMVPMVLDAVTSADSLGDPAPSTVLASFLQDTDNSYDDLVTAIGAIYAQMVESRYWVRRTPLTKRCTWQDFMEYSLNIQLPACFRQAFRMDWEDFWTIHQMIADDMAFTNNSRNPQRPIALQLLATLMQFGMFGNGASVEKVSEYTGISVGALHGYEGVCVFCGLLRFVFDG